MCYDFWTWAADFAASSMIRLGLLLFFRVETLNQNKVQSSSQNILCIKMSSLNHDLQGYNVLVMYILDGATENSNKEVQI